MTTTTIEQLLRDSSLLMTFAYHDRITNDLMGWL
jgi:hypothetical protein